MTIYGFTADRFQKRQEDVNEGLSATYAWTNTQQVSLHATGRGWIKKQCSKLRRRIARNCGIIIRPNDTYISVSSFSVFFILLLAGDIEVNPGPTATTSSKSPSEKLVIELPTLTVMGNLHQGVAYFSEESRGRQCAFMALTSLAYNHRMQ